VSGNTTSMFVTVFVGILDTVSGRVLYANGGHNPPVAIRTRGPVDYLAPAGGTLVGAIEGLSYVTEALVLSPGDALFLYTDGVTEASNPDAALFSEDRLRESLQALQTTSPEETVAAIKAEVDAFAAGADQADDITLMMLRFMGNSAPRT
jgi:sigma-B regulation protein RsbU (phosphoserine phosphatase)